MTDFCPGDRDMALGSSFAAGPRLSPRSPGSPRRAMRSSVNYAHLLAERLGLHLTDASWSAETAAQIADGGPDDPRSWRPSPPTPGWSPSPAVATTSATSPA